MVKPDTNTGNKPNYMSPLLVIEQAGGIWSLYKSNHVINVFRRQGCPHLGQGHGPIVSSRQGVYTTP